MSDTLKIAQYGLGPIGMESLKLAASKPWVEIVGGIDIDPAMVGKDLGELTGVASLKGKKVYGYLEHLIEAAKPDVVLHTTVSKFKAAFDQLAPLARQGISVVSSCEEMLYPELMEPCLASELDELCQGGGARMIGTGVNPGFVMDVLPVCMTGVSRDVRAIHVQRVVNASTRRAPLQKKIGSGIPAEEFQKMLNEGRAGHAGLKESLALIAHCMRWEAKDLKEVGEPVIADHDIKTRYFEVKKGLTCGIHQRATAVVNGGLNLTLDIKMYLDAQNPHDAIQIEGEPPLKVVVDGGVAGDHATVAALVNTARRILQAKPGLRLMTDLSVPCWS